MKIAMSWAVVALSAALLAACGTSHVSRGINADGWVDGEVVFPDRSSATLKEGTYPNPAGLKLLGTFQTKKQIAALIGPPHFREGVVGVREWDYILNFRGTAGKIETCQFKIVFTKDYTAQSFFKHPEICARALEDMEVTPGEFDELRGNVTISGDDATSGNAVELSADALFGFNDDAVQTSGRRAIAKLASDIKSTPKVTLIRVEGHTDRIGTDSWNNGLSERRAAAVRDALIGEGVPAARIESAGRGKTVPKVQCHDQARQELIACLAPNRRVVVTAYTSD